MMKVLETNPDVILYMQSLMKNYEKLEQENKQLKEDKRKAIEYIKEHQRKDEFLNLNEWQTRDLLEILGEKENE